MKTYKNPPQENSLWMIESPYGKEQARFAGVMPNGTHAWSVDGGTLFLSPNTPREPVEEIKHWQIMVFDIEGRPLGNIINDDVSEFEFGKAGEFLTYMSFDIVLDKIDYLRQGQPTYQYVARRVK